MLLTLAMHTPGCSGQKGASDLQSPYLKPVTFAVAPALNFSGARFDQVRVADLLASELAQIANVRVIGTNRVLAILAEQEQMLVTSPAMALDVAERLGADGILVFAVTEYDPYNPPIVGIAAQLYVRATSEAASGFDPVLASREAKPFAVEVAYDSPGRPRAQTQYVFNGAHEDTVRAVQRYAKSRGTDQSPMGWRKHLASQELFFRFCCHQIVRDLIYQGYLRAQTRRDADR